MKNRFIKFGALISSTTMTVVPMAMAISCDKVNSPTGVDAKFDDNADVIFQSATESINFGRRANINFELELDKPKFVNESVESQLNAGSVTVSEGHFTETLFHPGIGKTVTFTYTDLNFWDDVIFSASAAGTTKLIVWSIIDGIKLQKTLTVSKYEKKISEKTNWRAHGIQRNLPNLGIDIPSGWNDGFTQVWLEPNNDLYQWQAGLTIGQKELYFDGNKVKATQSFYDDVESRFQDEIDAWTSQWTLDTAKQYFFEHYGNWKDAE